VLAASTSLAGASPSEAFVQQGLKLVPAASLAFTIVR
jgi:hypothetical protein